MEVLGVDFTFVKFVIQCTLISAIIYFNKGTIIFSTSLLYHNGK